MKLFLCNAGGRGEEDMLSTIFAVSHFDSSSSFQSPQYLCALQHYHIKIIYKNLTRQKNINISVNIPLLLIYQKSYDKTFT